MDRTQTRLKKADEKHLVMHFTTNSVSKKDPGRGESQNKRILNRTEFLTVQVEFEWEARVGIEFGGIFSELGKKNED